MVFTPPKGSSSAARGAPPQPPVRREQSLRGGSSGGAALRISPLYKSGFCSAFSGSLLISLSLSLTPWSGSVDSATFGGVFCDSSMRLRNFLPLLPGRSLLMLWKRGLLTKAPRAYGSRCCFSTNLGRCGCNSLLLSWTACVITTVVVITSGSQGLYELFSPISFSFFSFFFFYGCTRGVWKFPGQELNQSCPRHSHIRYTL